MESAGTAPSTRGGSKSRATRSVRKPTKAKFISQPSSSKRRKLDNDSGEDDEENNDSDDESDSIQKGRPITNPLSAFIEMVRKAKVNKSDKFADLEEIAKKGGITFKVVTLCSGTESPIFALQLIQEAFFSVFGTELFRFEQLFAAEIVDFKQAFVARNSGCTVFSDIRQLLMGKTEATTAKGQNAPIPLNPTIVIAGTSCVDFSTLNINTQKSFSEKVRKFCDWHNQDREPPTLPEVCQMIQDITDDEILGGLGESEQTFFSMLAYVAEHKPWIVILENVLNAPFKSAKDHWFKPLGYTAWIGRLDTKNFYIPQTRQRKYLVAFREEKFPNAKDICRNFDKAIGCLSQKASATAADFLLAPNHPFALLARLELDDKAQRPKKKEGSDWAFSKLRHERVRNDEKLGPARPVTFWSDFGRPLNLYDRMNLTHWSSLPQRVLDSIDINQLRARQAKDSWDLFYKTKLNDHSQNIDRSILKAEFRIVGCITPSGLSFITCDARIVTGYETMALQGLPLEKIKFSRETQDQLKDLAGNAMSTTVVGAVLYAILMTSLDDLGNSPWWKDEDLGKISESQLPSPFISSSTQLVPQATTLDDIPEYETTGFVALSIEEVNEQVFLHRRYCFCNGTAQHSTTRLQKCNTCDMIRCANCAGNPVHDYRVYEHPAPEPQPHQVAEQDFLKYFPTVVTNLLDKSWEKDFHKKLSNKTRMLLEGACETSTNSKATTIFETLAKAKFLYQGFHITEVITLTYISDDGFNLKVVCTGSGIDWFVSLDEHDNHTIKVLNDNSELEGSIDLSRPFMKGTVLEGAVSPLHARWFVWDLEKITVKTAISVHEEPNNGKSIDLALEPTTGHLGEMAEQEITGRYLGAPNCDAAECSLFVRERLGVRKQSIRLFKDPTRSGPPSEDGFVVAYEHRFLGGHEHRELLLKIEPGAKLHKLEPGFEGSFNAEKLEFSHKDCKDGNHTLGELHLKNLPIGVPGESRPSDPMLLIQRMRWTHIKDDDWAVLRDDCERGFFQTIGYATSKSPAHFQRWARIVDTIASRCWECAPRMPQVFWDQATPYNNPETVEKYEKIRKDQPPTFQIQVKPSASAKDGLDDVSVRFVFNPVRLTHKAYGQMPKEQTAQLVDRAPIITTARIQPQHVDSLMLKLKPLPQSLRPFSPTAATLGGDEKNPFANSNHALKDCQKTTVAWMLRHERCPEPFVEREREEELIEGLHLRLLADASRMVVRRGGIVADDIGFGKTVMTLALLALQEEFDKDYYELRQKKHTKNSITATNCTVIICPFHIVDQWGSEIDKFLVIREGVDGFKLARKWSDLKGTDPTKYRILIISDQIFADRKYTKEWGSCVDGESPTDGMTPTALAKWVDGRGYAEWYASAIKKIRSGDDAGFCVLERYSFSRIVWDEVSYNNPRVSSFVANCDAVSKWLLSGTPPTRDLKDVCSLARNLGLHIARPVDLRFGLPRIADGPSLSPRTQFETIESYGITKSSDFITERHQQAERFLGAFTACNKVDHAKEGLIVHEHVLVCPPSPAEASTYQALEDEVRAADMDVEDLTREGAKRLKSVLKYPQELLDGEDLCIKGLIHTSTLPSIVISSYEQSSVYDRNKPYQENLLNIRKTLLREACVFFRYVFKKLIWLAARLHRTIHQGRKPANQAQKDKEEYDGITKSLSSFLDSLNKGRHQDLKGLDNYVELAKAVLSVEGDEIHKRLSSNEDILAATNDNNSGTIHEAFRTNNDNINLLYQSFNSKWHEFYLLAPEDVRGLIKKKSAKIPDDDVLNLLLDHREQDENSKQGADSLRNELADRIESIMSGRQEDLKNNRDNYHESHPDEDEDPTNMKKDELVEILTREGLMVPTAKSKNDLAKLLETHKQQSAGFNAYRNPGAAACHAATTMPFLDGDVTARGSTQSQTKSEYQATWTIFATARNRFEEEAAQVRRAEQFCKVDSGEEMTCSELGCESTDSLALVSRCGHVLCRGHWQGKESCGAGGCEAPLDNGVTELSRFSDFKDRSIAAQHLKSPDPHEVPASIKNLDSKLRHVISLIRAVPKEECVVLFGQHQAILEKTVQALKDNGITCTSTNSAAATVSDPSPLELFKGGRIKVLVMKVNSAEAAGGNLVRANHVIFLTPIIGNSQHLYDSYMRQASGRCIRYGQDRPVHVYHCVTEGTLEVNILELRQRKKVKVAPGVALGRLVPRRNPGQADQNNGDDEVQLESVRSQMSAHETWKGLKEVDMALSLDFVDTRLDTNGAYLHETSPSGDNDAPSAQGTDTGDEAIPTPALVHFADLPEDERKILEERYERLCEKYKWPENSGKLDLDNDDGGPESNHDEDEDTGPPAKMKKPTRKGPPTGKASATGTASSKTNTPATDTSRAAKDAPGDLDDESDEAPRRYPGRRNLERKATEGSNDDDDRMDIGGPINQEVAQEEDPMVVDDDNQEQQEDQNTGGGRYGLRSRKPSRKRNLSY